MSEKRFTLLDEVIFDNVEKASDGGRKTYWVISYNQRKEVVGLLNSLYDENEQLRRDLEDYGDANATLEAEILKLRQTVHNLKQEPTNKDWDLLVQKCAELSQRNVELWEKIGELKYELGKCREKNDELQGKIDYLCEKYEYKGE